MAFNVLTRRAGAPYDPDDLTREINENFDSTAEVSLSTIADGEVLQYNGSSSVFINVTVSAMLASGNIEDLGDVTFSSTVTDGSVLTYNTSSGEWIDAAIPAQSISALSDTNISSTPTDGDVLTWNESSGEWIDSAPYERPTTIDQKVAAYTLVNGDFVGNKIIEVSNASAVDVTIPTGLTNSEPVTIVQTGAGTVSIAGDTGVTINSAGGSLALRVQWSSVSIIPRSASDTYLVVGDLA